MKKFVRLGLLVGAITISTFATVKPTHAALPDCSTVQSQTCTTQGSIVYCQDYCTYIYKCEKFLGGLRWKLYGVDPSDPNYGHCA